MSRGLRAVLGGVAGVLLAIGLWSWVPDDDHDDQAALPSPMPAPSTAPRAPQASPAPPPRPVEAPAARVPQRSPPPRDPMDALVDGSVMEVDDDTGRAVTPAKAIAAQLHLIPITDDEPLPADDTEAALERLADRGAACLPGTDTPSSVDVVRAPVLDGSGSVLQVTQLPAGHADAPTLACLTEVLRQVRFESARPEAFTWSIGG